MKCRSKLKHRNRPTLYTNALYSADTEATRLCVRRPSRLEAFPFGRRAYHRVARLSLSLATANEPLTHRVAFL